MSATSKQIDSQAILQWFRSDIAPELQEILNFEMEDRLAEHSPAEHEALLRWFARRVSLGNIRGLRFPDGPADGKIDIYVRHENEARIDFHIVQLHAPSFENLTRGRFGPDRDEKLSADISEFYRHVRGDASGLNPTARLCFIELKDAIRRVDGGDEDREVWVHIRPYSLKRIAAAERQRIEDLAAAALQDWSTARVHFRVSKPHSAEDLYADYLRVSDDTALPDEIELAIVGKTGQTGPNGPYICFVRAHDVVAAYRTHKAALLHANTRNALGNTKVNLKLESALTHLSALKDFHERNNGLVVTCFSVAPVRRHQAASKRGRQGDEITHLKLRRPQLVNGGQTIHTITQVLDRLLLEARDDDEKTILRFIHDDLVLSAKIIATERPNDQDAIAIASNTQNSLSDRSLAFSHSANGRLRRALCSIDPPWFLEVKDKEWEAFAAATPQYQKALTGGRRPADFKVVQQAKSYRKIPNDQLGQALLAFYGFIQEAKVSKVFDETHFPSLFEWRPSVEGWRRLASGGRSWKPDTEAFLDSFDGRPPDASVAVLAFGVLQYWKNMTLTEKEVESVLLVRARTAYADLEAYDSWLAVPDARRADLLKDESLADFAARERIAKSAYLVLVYQTMRVLLKVYGPLTSAVGEKVLRLPEFKELADGQLGGTLDFRAIPIGRSPLSSIAQLLMIAVNQLWQEFGSQISKMGSPQQTLLQAEWVARLSAKVDQVCDKPTLWYLLDDFAPETAITKLSEAFPTLGEHSTG
ncbi:MAG TPA: AIPR family protein [Thermoanaerobaculia bacterium]